MHFIMDEPLFFATLISSCLSLQEDEKPMIKKTLTRHPQAQRKEGENYGKEARKPS